MIRDANHIYSHLPFVTDFCKADIPYVANNLSDLGLLDIKVLWKLSF